MKNGCALMYLDKRYENPNDVFRKAVKHLHDCLIKAQNQKTKKNFCKDDNFEKICGPFKSFKKSCILAAKENHSLWMSLNKIEKIIREKSDQKKLDESGPRLQNYIIPTELDLSVGGRNETGLYLLVKDNCRLNQTHGVKIVSVQYCKDIFAPFAPDLLKNVIKGQKPYTVEVTLMDDKRNIIENHPIGDYLLRFSSNENLVDFLDKLAHNDKVNMDYPHIGYNFMTTNNDYFVKTRKL